MALSDEREWRTAKRELPKAGASQGLILYFKKLLGSRGQVATSPMAAAEYIDTVVQGGVQWTETRRDHAIACFVQDTHRTLPQVGSVARSFLLAAHSRQSRFSRKAAYLWAEFCREYLDAETIQPLHERLGQQLSLISSFGKYVADNSLSTFTINACATMALRKIAQAWTEFANIKQLVSRQAVFDMVTARATIAESVQMADVELELKHTLEIGKFLLSDAADSVIPSTNQPLLMRQKLGRASLQYYGAASLKMDNCRLNRSRPHRMNFELDASPSR
ncbi:hypothetical protein B0H14DRAFT_2578643 [Mycena olivaceomarginata]|nr:hypothetical protein B0H14DRAFT_2578643 [Mycena olivaceomarginata]